MKTVTKSDATVPLGGHVRVPKTAEVIASRIRNAIVRGNFKAGDILPVEATLIGDFDVSRPTLREAIRILEAEGLIAVLRGARGGARILGATGEQVTRAAGLALQTKGATLRDIYEARTQIEPLAARLAAERRPAEAASALEAYLALEWKVADDQTSRATAVAEFHRVLLVESGNITLGLIGEALHGVVERHFQLSYRSRKQTRSTTTHFVETAFASHKRLIDLIAAGDADGAEKHWRSFMEAAGQLWLKGIESLTVLDFAD